MALRRTYVDACVLIAAFKGTNDLSQRAIAVLDDPERTLILSDAVWLEVVPKARYYKQTEEIKFYEEIFDHAERVTWNKGSLYKASDLAEAHGIGAMDAIHIAMALEAHADELVTKERPTKPMFRLPDMTICSLFDN